MDVIRISYSYNYIHKVMKQVSQHVYSFLMHNYKLLIMITIVILHKGTISS